MKTIDKVIVVRVYAKGQTYYLTNYHGNVTLDGEDYEPYVLDVSDADKMGNFGEGFQIGKCSVTVLNGEKWYQGNYIFDMTQAWNKRKCEIKLCDVSSESAWADCEWYYSGIIQNLKISNNKIGFDVDDKNYKDDIVVPSATVESVVQSKSYLSESDIPKKFKGKRVPMQVGELTDTANGEFGKCVTISNKIGFQEVVGDACPLLEFDGIGIWEDGLKRYFLGRKRTVVDGTVEGEYEVNDNLNGVRFLVDSTCSVNGSTGAGSGIQTFTVTDYELLQWVDEDSVDNEEDYPELLSTNIIAVENELMMIVEKPTSNTIRVERGYNGTTVSDHTNQPIYQSAKFAARNLLSFTEKFPAYATSNQYYGEYHDGAYTVSAATDLITDGNWSDVVDENTSTYIEMKMVKANYNDVGFDHREYCNFDIKFPKIEESVTVYNAFAAIKYDINLNKTGGTSTYSASLKLSGSQSTSFSAIDLLDFMYAYLISGLTANGTTSEAFDSWTSIERTDGARDNYDYNNNANVSATNITSLTDLNKKWKVQLQFQITMWTNVSITSTIKIYNIGMWLDFFLDFTRRTMMASLKGRYNTSESINLTSVTESSKPCNVIIDILVRECGFVESDFDSTSWSTVGAYFNISSNFPSSPTAVPEIAFSYGIDEYKKGWEFCEWIASHFGLMIIKNDQGKVKVINLHRLQNTDGTVGYPSMSSYGIYIDDIIISGSERLLSLQQTGTDRLRNNISIKYKRNNSTGEYQAAYPEDLDAIESYTLPESGITLLAAYNNYYDGEPTELWEIESPFIYNREDAKRLWQWHINDKAEIFFWLTLTIDYEHYNLVNSKSEQYEIGDLIYLDGVYSGITFDSNHLFVVRNLRKKDQGREIELQCKSIEPISEFTSNAEGQNPTFQHTLATGDEFQHTTGTGDEYQHKL